MVRVELPVFYFKLFCSSLATNRPVDLTNEPTATPRLVRSAPHVSPILPFVALAPAGLAAVNQNIVRLKPPTSTIPRPPALATLEKTVLEVAELASRATVQSPRVVTPRGSAGVNVFTEPGYRATREAKRARDSSSSVGSAEGIEEAGGIFQKMINKAASSINGATGVSDFFSLLTFYSHNSTWS